jgi:hypothetical protein
MDGPPCNSTIFQQVQTYRCMNCDPSTEGSRLAGSLLSFLAKKFLQNL